MTIDEIKEKMADKIFLSAQRFVCLDVCGECCNFGQDSECQHENAIGKWDDMIECPQDRLVANALAQQLLSIPITEQECPRCQRTGKVHGYSPAVPPEFHAQYLQCPDCKGTGKVRFTIEDAIKRGMG